MLAPWEDTEEAVPQPTGKGYLPGAYAAQGRAGSLRFIVLECYASLDFTCLPLYCSLSDRARGGGGKRVRARCGGGECQEVRRLAEQCVSGVPHNRRVAQLRSVPP